MASNVNPFFVHIKTLCREVFHCKDFSQMDSLETTSRSPYYLWKIICNYLFLSVNHNVLQCNKSKLCWKTTVGCWICQLTSLPLVPVISRIYFCVYYYGPNYLLFWSGYSFEIHLNHLVSVIKGGQKIALLRLDTEPCRDKITYLSN